MSEVKINKVHFMDTLVERGASEEIVNLLNCVKRINFKDTNTTIILVESARIDTTRKEVL